MKEYLRSCVEVMEIFRDAARLVIEDTLEWADNKLADMCDLGGEDD